MIKVICSRFDDSMPVYTNVERVVIKTNVNVKRRTNYFHCLSSDGVHIFDSLGMHTVEDFIECQRDKIIHLMVLTDREREYLIKPFLNQRFVVHSFESNFPVFDDVKYTGFLEGTYKFLLKKLSILRGYGVQGRSLLEAFNLKISKKIKNKVRQKTSLDKIYAHAYLPPYQEVFSFADLRENRKIISLDFNSMFSYCLGGDFVVPSDVYALSLMTEYKKEKLKCGLYKVSLVNPTCDFIKEYHPFKFTSKGISVHFSASNEMCIDVQLFSFEVEYYADFFEKVILHEAIVSDNTSGHPCYSESKRLYRLRKKAKLACNKPLERLYKFQLAMLHSSTNPRRYRTDNLDSLGQAFKILNEEFFIKEKSDSFEYLFGKYSFFKLAKENDRYTANRLDINSDSCIFSFSSQVLARSRLEIVKTIHALLDFPGLDICYVNTDSVHVSIPAESYILFLNNYNEIIGDDLGQMKIQVVADKGVWFDLGHYYLLEDGNVKLYKNSFLNKKGARSSFVFGRKILSKYKHLEQEVLAEKFITFPNILSSKKILDHDERDLLLAFKRFNMEDIDSHSSLRLRILSERYRSTEFKIKYFNILRMPVL